MRYIRLILAGALLGAGLYFTPFFVLRFFLFGFLIFGLFRLFAFSRYGWGRHGRWAYAGGPGSPFGPGMRGYGPMGFADKVRSMTEAEYKAFQDRFNSAGPWGGGYGAGCGPRQGWGRGRHGMHGQPAPETPSTETPTSPSPEASV